MPWSASAHTACSRDEPQPKLRPVTSTVPALYSSWLSTKSARPRVAPPVVEQELAIAVALDALEELLGDDLIGVDVGAIQRDEHTLLALKRLHAGAPAASSCRTSTKCPSTAAAAAITGETRCVRPPRPCRPSKLRLLVLAHRSPGWRMSGFMPRHIEHPGCAIRHRRCGISRPSPSFSACSFTCAEPGHHEHAQPGMDPPSIQHRGGSAQILDAAVGTGAEEHGVECDIGDRCARLEAHVCQRAHRGTHARLRPRTTRDRERVR